MRVAASLGPNASDRTLQQFRAPGVELAIIDEFRSDDRFDAVLIFGGDGSVHRQLRALREAGVPLLVVPAGSGNDFARELRLNTVRRAWRAWRKCLAGAGNVREIDLGVIHEPPSATSAGVSENRIHYFCCIAGVGLDSNANRRANEMRPWIRAHGGYVLAALREIATYQFPKLELQMKQAPCADAAKPAKFIRNEGEACRYEGSATLVVFGNGRSYGDGMKIAPLARLDDGLLDVCLLTQTPRSRLLRFFPTVYTGHHLHLPEVDYMQTDSIRVRTTPAMDVYADGEYICRTPIEVTVANKTLKVIV